MQPGPPREMPAGAGPPTPSIAADRPVSRRPRPGRRRLAWSLVLAAIAAAGGYLADQWYRTARLAGSVRRSFAARRYDEARGPLQRWLDRQPRSGEAQYYRAWLALADQRPRDATEAIERARQLGFDPASLRVLIGVYQARAGQIDAAEPILRAAFDRKAEPRAEVARELVRIYLTTYRLAQAAEAVERCRELSPEDPQPYLWSNEIDSRSGAAPSLLIRNYRAALERDPDLDKARLGLADQLSKDRRYDEAEQEYGEYLRRRPGDASALVGLGRNAFQSGDLDGATRQFERALELDPRQPEALKKLAQIDMRLGQYERSCRRLELLTRIDPFDSEIRYSYAQALKMAGDPAGARHQSEQADRLRKENEQIDELRVRMLKDPENPALRFEVTRWMLEHGHDEEGLKWAKEVLRADPRHGPTHRALADYYAKHGDPGLANYHRTMASSGPEAK